MTIAISKTILFVSFSVVGLFMFALSMFSSQPTFGTQQTSFLNEELLPSSIPPHPDDLLVIQKHIRDSYRIFFTHDNFLPEEEVLWFGNATHIIKQKQLAEQCCYFPLKASQYASLPEKAPIFPSPI